MSEPYTDEELDEGIRSFRVDPLNGAFIGRLSQTIARLQRERNEARRVARSVAAGWMTYLLTGKLPEPAADLDTALAYPEQDSTKET